jgi:hypothetical protein
MRTTVLVTIVAALAVAAPAQARSGTVRGTVLALHTQRGTLVLARASGAGLTVHGATAHVRVGDRVLVQTTAPRDGTFRAAHLRVLSHERRAIVRGVVMRRLARSTLVATGHSIVRIRSGATRNTASARDHGDLRIGEIGEFRIRFDDDDLFAEHVQAVGQAGNVRIEGAVVSVSPFVVSLEGLPITITVPTGITLPAGLAAGDRIELTVQAGTGNVFTLVSIDEVENANPATAANDDVDVRGHVVSSTATQIVIASGGSTFTFTAPTGVTLPILAQGTFVRARGVTRNGVLILERLRLEDDGGGGDGGGDGGH